MRTLKKSTLTPGSYEPSDAVKNDYHAAVLVDFKPVVICGYSDMESVSQARALARSDSFKAILKAAGIVADDTAIIGTGQIFGGDINWSQAAAIVSKTSGEVSRGGEDGPLVAIVLDDPGHAIATALCTNSETAKIFDANAPELDDGRKLPNLARQRSMKAEELIEEALQLAKGEKTYLSVPFEEKDAAKAHGARWDRNKRSWYVPPGKDPAAFAKWATQGNEGVDTGQKERIYLAVPYGERLAAKAAGALWDKVAGSWYAGPKADMEKLARWLPENVANQQSPAMSPRQEFAQALQSLGCIVTGDHPIMDGKPHRICVEDDKKGEKAGFYVGHLDGHPAGYIKNNRSGVHIKWRSKGYTLSAETKATLQAEAAQKLAERAKEHKRQQEAAAQRVISQMKALVPVVGATPYLRSKGIDIGTRDYQYGAGKGVLTDKQGLKTYIPVYDVNGKIWSMQYIREDGTKRFAKNSRKEGCFHVFGGEKALAAAPVLVIAEGYATAASLAGVLDQATVCSFDSGNLPHVAKALHEKYPDKPVIIAGDDDRHLKANPGRAKAGGKAIFPTFAPGESSKSFTDFNDLATKSELGKAGLSRQVRPVIERAKDRSKPMAVEQNKRHQMEKRLKRRSLSKEM